MSNSLKENEQKLLNVQNEKESFEFQNQREIPQNWSNQTSTNFQQGISIKNTSDYNQMNIKESSLEDLIQKQCFRDQKIFIIKILIIFFFWSFVQFFLNYGLLLGMSEFIDQVAPYLFPISLIFMYGLAKLGTLQQFRRFPDNLIILIIEIYLSTQTYLSFCRLFRDNSQNNDDGIHFNTADLVFLIVEYQFIYNCFITLILIAYLAIEKEKIKMFIPIATCCIFALIPLIFNIWLFINSIFAVLYGSIIIIVIQQIVKGRLQMQINNVIAATNILYFGLIVPIDIF